ncbi:MAG: 16S rRNA (guanine(966)-N(2))-methyltransferase RsmD [Halieaceae bacterium]
MARNRPAGQTDSKLSQLRIIGGQWRGRKLSFHATPGLRPTTDRIRETVFNWLAPFLQDARCADLFAGSGALGLEALSRGAAYCDFVDTSASAVSNITEHLAMLSAQDRGLCTRAQASDFLGKARPPYDIIFVDPPFDDGLAGETLALLTKYQALPADGLVYLETSSRDTAPEIPPDWTVFRQKSSGGVNYQLLLAGEQT